jgi:deoxyinosine 3'endonuclease (endonuclease V)
MLRRKRRNHATPTVREALICATMRRPTAAVASVVLLFASALLSRQRTRWWLRQRWLSWWLVERDIRDFGNIRLVGGVDVSFIKDSNTDACACLVVLDASTLTVVWHRCRRVVLNAPYIPGYLAFREIGFFISLLDELRAESPQLLPEVIMVDGNGVLHPSRFGLACHLGVLSGVPTVGCGKTLHHVDGLTVKAVKSLYSNLTQRFASAKLVGRSGAVWGALLRTSKSVDEASFKPVIVSVGHGISLDSAIALTVLLTKHRIPEPVRQADLRGREWLRLYGAAADPNT